MVSPLTPNDAELNILAQGNPYLVEVLRELFDQTGTISPEAIEEALITAENASAKANQANSVLEGFKKLLELSALSPRQELPIIGGDVLPRHELPIILDDILPRQELGTISHQNSDNINISGGKISGVGITDSDGAFKDLSSSNTANFSNAGLHVGGTDAKNLFNNYINDTYVAALTADSGTITLNSSFNRLSFVRNGNICNISGNIEVTSVSSPTGLLFLSLPIVCASLAQNSERTVGVPMISGLTGALSSVPFFRTADGSSTAILFESDGATQSTVSAALVQATTNFTIDLTYPV